MPCSVMVITPVGFGRTKEAKKDTIGIITKILQWRYGKKRLTKQGECT